MHPILALLESFVWWIRLTPAQQLFYGIGIMAGLATLVMAGLALIGLDHHDVPDVSVDHGGGTSLFSTKPLTGFFLGFGWGGGIAIDAGASVPVATVIGLGADIEVISADGINEAYERVVAGDVRYRFVIDIATLRG